MDAKGRVVSEKRIADEVPFEKLPEGWSWVRLSNVASIQLGKMLDKRKNQGEPVPYLGNANVQWGRFDLANVKTMSMSEADRAKFALSDGDLIVCEGGVPGRCAIWASNVTMYYQKALHRIRCNKRHLLNTYCELYICFIVLSHVWDSCFTGTTIKHLPAQTLSNWILPLPPLAEQRRIVKRVDELMPLVEEYGELEDAREALDAALPGRLRKSVLQMAVQGKLVPQGPADEPASELLERIREQRRQLIAEKKMKAPKGGESVIFAGSDGRRYEKRVDAKGRESEPVCIEDEIPFDIPKAWAWARLGAVSSFYGGATPDKGNPKYWGGSLCWASMKDIHGDVLYETLDHITQEGLDSKASISVCHPGDLVVSTRLIPGKSIISDIDSAINQDLKIVRSEAFDIAYLHLWFQSMLEKFKRMGSGTTVPGIKLDQLSGALIPVPPRSEQLRIAKHFESLVSHFN